MTSRDESAGDSSKGGLNRREYLKLGAAATAVSLGAGVGMADTSSAVASENFSTGFGEYVT